MIYDRLCQRCYYRLLIIRTLFILIGVHQAKASFRLLNYDVRPLRGVGKLCAMSGKCMQFY